MGDETATVAAAADTKSNSAATKEVVVKPVAFELAKGWLQKMTGGEKFDAEKDDDENGGWVEPEARPLRLGLGAKFVTHSQAALLPTASPVAKRLRKQIDNARRNSEDQINNTEKKSIQAEEPEAEEEESRTQAFRKNKLLENQDKQQLDHPPKKKNKKNKNKKQKIQPATI